MVSFNKQNILTPITVSIFLPCACFSLALWIFLCLIGGCLFSVCADATAAGRRARSEISLLGLVLLARPSVSPGRARLTHTHTLRPHSLRHTHILTHFYTCEGLSVTQCEPLTHSPETSITTDTRLNLSLTLTYNDSNISATRKCRPSNNHL